MKLLLTLKNVSKISLNSYSKLIIAHFSRTTSERTRDPNFSLSIHTYHLHKISIAVIKVKKIAFAWNQMHFTNNYSIQLDSPENSLIINCLKSLKVTFYTIKKYPQFFRKLLHCKFRSITFLLLLKINIYRLRT